MPVNVTRAFMQRLMDNHPDEAARMHRAALGGLGLADDAQQFMVDKNAPELMFHPDIAAIRARPKSEHAQRVAELHRRESSGPEGEPENDNYDTEEYLGDRAKRTTTHKRAKVPRYV